MALLPALFFALLVVPPFFLLATGAIYWLPLIFLGIPVIVLLESLLLTPLYRLIGRFHYYSPMLMSTRSGEQLHLHVGTVFDYVMHLRWADRGGRAQRIVLEHILRGLLRLCVDVEDGRIARSTPIHATSYFFSDRSAARLGFTIGAAPSSQLQNLLTAWLSIAVRLSFTSGRLRYPDLRQARLLSTTAAELLKHRAEIADMLSAVKRVR